MFCLITRVPNIDWIPLVVIILFLLNIFNLIITVIDVFKQCMIIECDIIKRILVKRGIELI